MIPTMTERACKLMAAVPIEGCLVEFGVYKGGGLSTIAQFARKYLHQIPPSYGFDSFEGMPPTDAPLEGIHAQGWTKGAFSDTDLEGVQQRLRSEGVQAHLIKGVFADLSPLAEYGINKVRFAHIDCDIYEGYRDALQLLTPHIQVGTVMLFDESHPPTDYSQQCIRFHGKRAVAQWEEATGFNLHLVRFERTVDLCVVVDEDYLKLYSPIIERLRRDTVQESIENIVKTILGKSNIIKKAYRRYHHNAQDMEVKP